MAKQSINVSTANSGLGDPLRTAFVKINSNFTELYAALGLDAGGLNLGAFQFSGSVMSTTDSTPMVLNQAVSVTGDLTVGGDLLPNNDLQVNLGSPSKKWHSLYVGTGSVYIGDAKLSLEGGTLNSSVGFSTDSLTIGGVALTVNNAGQVQADTGFALTNILPADAAGVLTNDGTGILSWGAGGGSGSTDRITANGISVYVSGNGTLVLPATDTELVNTAVVSSTANIQVNSNGSFWTFGNNGNLTIPTNSTIIDPANTDINRGGHAINITGQRGYGNWGTTGNAGWGTSIYLRAGDGGETDTANSGGEGGAVEIRSGWGQAGENGGAIRIVAGDAMYNGGSTGNVHGGHIEINAGGAQAGNGVNNGQGGNVIINAGQGTIQNGKIQLGTNGNYWNFSENGALKMPQANSGASYQLAPTTEVTVAAGVVPTVVYTSTGQFINSMKAIISVFSPNAPNQAGDQICDTQVCEMLITTRYSYINSTGTVTKTAVATVYGITHTSDTPLATFTVNLVQSVTGGNIQILAQPTGLVVSEMDVQVVATEILGTP